MKVIGNIIARLGSKRLTYKNILPFDGEPMLGVGIKKLKASSLVNEVVVSTESELVARIAYDYGATILKRPKELAEDNVPSVPVFQHIMDHYPGDVYVNYNVNFPMCEVDVIDRGIEIAVRHGESLSVPFAIWAQTASCLKNYKDPWTITAHRYDDDRAGPLDIHTEEDLLECYRKKQGCVSVWEAGKKELTP